MFGLRENKVKGGKNSFFFLLKEGGKNSYLFFDKMEK